MPATCAMCGDVFAAERSTATFCSSRCRTRWHRSGRGPAPATAPIATVQLDELEAKARIDLLFGDSIRWRTLHDQDDHDAFPHIPVRGTPPVDVNLFMAVRASDAAFAATDDPNPAIPPLMRPPTRLAKRRPTRHAS